MSVELTIIGIGQIGASIGLSLKAHTNLLHRRGYDKELGFARRAQARGALDKVYINLPNAVSGADIILLALPMSEIRKTLEIIAPDLKEGAVVMDTSPVKSAVAAWAQELLAPERYYIGLTPVLQPAYLYSAEFGDEAARADLFQNTPMLIAAPPGTASEAVKLAADLTRLLGATPLFTELVEVDSLMAGTHILPQLLAAALVNATADQPGWLEGRKLAGRAYTEVTAPLGRMMSAQALADAAILNRANMLRVMDTFISALTYLRADIEREDHAALSERLTRAGQARERWWGQRLRADWSSAEQPEVKLPSASQIFSRFLGIQRKEKTEG
ncbi:MAG: hypothetical protein Fur0018_23550 [Anaerolineales bacterium]